MQQLQLEESLFFDLWVGHVSFPLFSCFEAISSINLATTILFVTATFEVHLGLHLSLCTSLSMILLLQSRTYQSTIDDLTPTISIVSRYPQSTVPMASYRCTYV